MDNESTLEIDSFGNKRWKNKHGKFHRLGGPAIEYLSGAEEWYENGLRHRSDGPAAKFGDGTKFWRLRGIAFKNKEDFFLHLSEEEKRLALFSVDFLNG
jgi:hypothetical protein